MSYTFLKVIHKLSDISFMGEREVHNYNKVNYVKNGAHYSLQKKK